MIPLTIKKFRVPPKSFILAFCGHLLIIFWITIMVWVYWIAVGMPGINNLSYLISVVSNVLIAIVKLINTAWINFYHLNVNISQFLTHYFSATYLQ